MLVEVTVKVKEENSLDFCPNYAQEFGLSYRTTRDFFIYKNDEGKHWGRKSKVIRNGVRTQSDMQQYWTKEK